MFSNMLGGDAPPPPYSSQSNSETSLATLLPTANHRVECALLILLCTDELRRSISSTFELPERYTTIDDTAPSAAADLISFDGPEVVDTHVLKRNKLRRQQELSSSEIQGSKRASFTYFDSWRGKVLRRVCDALNVRAETIRQARKQHATRLASAEKQQRHDDLVDWARGDGPSKKSHYKAVPTQLTTKLDKETRILLLQCLVLLLLSIEIYPAHSRILLLHITVSLKLDNSVLVQHESQIAHGLLEAAQQMSGEESRKARAAENAASSKWKIGLATVAGAALIGVTGGLAAPLLAAGLGTVFGGLGLGAVSGLLGALAGNTLLIGGLFGAYGGKMTGKMMERYEKEVEDFKFLPIRCPRDENVEQHQHVDISSRRPTPVRTKSSQLHKLRVAIGVTGSLTTELDMIAPWSVLDSTSLEPFALRWEVSALLRLGVSLSSVLKSYAWQYAKWEIARRTLFGVLAAGLWPLGLLKMARVLDNPFSIAQVRADKAGKVLADAIISKCQGERPVTLIGFSVGARVIYSCLLELAAQNAFGLVENAVLIGTSSPSGSVPWTKMRSVVSGRLVNVYSKEDYILGFLYRASSAQFDVAGLQSVEDVNGVENFDVSDLVSGHTKYRYVTGQILQRIGLEDVDEEEVEKEIAILHALESQETTEESSTQADADAETAEIESRVRARVGSPVNGRIVMMDVDEGEEERRRQLLSLAEKRAREEQGHPPAYEEYYAPSGASSSTQPPAPPAKPQQGMSSRPHSKPASELQPREKSISSIPAPNAVQDHPPTSLIHATEELRVTPPRISVENLDTDTESEDDGAMGDLAHVEPEPVDDSDDEPESERKDKAVRK
jgi:hypothetical protein